jgi:hypothetical protein
MNTSETKRAIREIERPEGLEMIAALYTEGALEIQFIWGAGWEYVLKVERVRAGNWAVSTPSDRYDGYTEETACKELLDLATTFIQEWEPDED